MGSVTRGILDHDCENEDEKVAYKEVLDGKRSHEKCPTHMAILNTCRRVGFEMDDMLQIIRHHAIRNEIVHANFIPLIKAGLFCDLKKRLNDDICSLPLIIPVTEKMLLGLMRKLLETIIDHWFSLDLDEDNYQTWAPTPELENHYKSLNGPDPPDEVTPQKEISARIVKAMPKRLRDEQKGKEILKIVSQAFRLHTSSRVKRVASSQLKAENSRVKRMKRDWDKILSLADNARKLSNAYFHDYGKLGAPPEVVADPSLDE